MKRIICRRDNDSQKEIIRQTEAEMTQHAQSALPPVLPEELLNSIFRLAFTIRPENHAQQGCYCVASACPGAGGSMLQ